MQKEKHAGRRQKPLYHESLKKIFLQAFPFLLLSGLGELFAGVVLQNFLRFIELFPGILVLLPALMNLKGAIASSLAARLGTAYHTGLTGKDVRREVRENLVGALLLGVTTVFVSAILAFLVSQVTGFKTISLIDYVVIAVSAGFVGVLALSLITIGLWYYSSKHGIDPNNATFPLISTVGDFIIIGLVYAMLALLAWR